MPRIIRTVVIVAAALAIAFASGTAGATTQTYLDRASWEPAAGSFEVEDFETTPVVGFDCSDFIGLSFHCATEIVIATPKLDIVIPVGADNIGGHQIIASGSVNGTREYKADLHSGVLVEGISYNTIVFPMAVTSFAVDLANVFDHFQPPVNDYLVPFPLIMELAGETFAIASGATFFGLTSTSSFDQVVVRSWAETGGDAVGARFDDISFTAVPEPSTGLLLLAGLFFCGRRSPLRRCRMA